MTALDPVHWSWARLTALSVAWVFALSLAAAWLVMRAMDHAKETTAAEGDFVTVLPYGTRHLTIYILLVLLPPILALARKLTAG